jgi:hypothetical protein
MSKDKKLDLHLPKCECGGKRKITAVIKAGRKYIATCNNCLTGYVIIKDKEGR